MSETTFAILREMLPIDAGSGQERAIMEYAEALLARRGYDTQRIPVGDPAEQRFNVLGIFQKPSVLLTTHLDTVPPHLEWREDAEHFYGRGACDAKGCAAAMLAAGEALQVSKSPHGILFVVGEETTSDGAKTVAATMREALAETRYIIDGEPTDCRWVRGTLGTLSGTLVATGIAAHSAYPERGRSALHDTIGVLHRWLTMDWPEDADLGPSYLNVGTLHGGAAANVLAARAETVVLARCTVPHAHVAARMLDGLPPDMTWTTRSASDPQRLVVPDFAPESIVVRFGTDVPFLAPLAPCLLFGPGSIEVAHSVGEFVSKKELSEAARQYERAVRFLLEQQA